MESLKLKDLTKAEVVEIAQLSDAFAFDKAFIEATRVYPTYEEAYESVEEKYILVHKRRRYTNYQSFRKSRTKRLSSK